MTTPTLSSVPMDHPIFKGITDWIDQSVIHRAVMSLFPKELAGAPDVRRAESAILYRLEPTLGRVLLQSCTPLSAEADGVKTTSVRPLIQLLASGQRARLRMDINAVRVESKTKRRIPVSDDLIDDWFRSRLGEGFDICQRIDYETQVRKMGDVPLHTVLVSTEATIRNRDAAMHMLMHGVGRARAYGCGLVSLALLS